MTFWTKQKSLEVNFKFDTYMYMSYGQICNKKSWEKIVYLSDALSHNCDHFLIRYEQCVTLKCHIRDESSRNSLPRFDAQLRWAVTATEAWYDKSDNICDRFFIVYIVGRLLGKIFCFSDESAHISQLCRCQNFTGYALQRDAEYLFLLLDVRVFGYRSLQKSVAGQ